MNFNYKIFDVLQSRQINFGNILGPSFYQKKIIKSCLDSIDNFNLSHEEFFENKNFFFSEDGDYIASDNHIWRVQDNFFFDESCKVMDLPELFIWSKSLAFNKDSSKLFISGYEYDIKNEVSIFDLIEPQNISSFRMNFDVGEISSSPSSSNIFVFDCENGDIYLKDLRISTPILKDKDIRKIRTLHFNPIKDHLILVASKNVNGVFVLDLRNSQHVMSYNTLFNHELNISSARYNRNGDQILLNKINSNPLLYYLDDPYPVCEFDDFGFFNSYQTYITYEPSKTLKNSCFVGLDDDFVAVSSNNNNVYVWEIPSKKLIEECCDISFKANSAKFILKHSNRVNFVQYNYKRTILGCSENDGSTKFWSPFEFVSNFKFKRKYTNDSLNMYYDPIYETNLKLKEFISSCFPRRYHSGFNADYFMTSFHIFKDTHANDFYTEMKEDLNLIYIKSFISNYDKTLKYENSSLLKKINGILDKEFDFINFFRDGHYLSIFIEIVKLFLLKVFILKSLKYLNSQNSKIKILKKEILFSRLVIHDWKKKLSSLMKVKMILDLMKTDLKLILIEDEGFVDPFGLLKKYTKFFSCYPEITFDHYEINNQLKVLKALENQINKKEFFEPKQKVLKHKSQENLFLNLFEENLNENLSDLKKILLFKKKKEKKLL